MIKNLVFNKPYHKKNKNEINFLDELFEFDNQLKKNKFLGQLEKKTFYCVLYFAKKYNPKIFNKYDILFWHRMYFPSLYSILSITEICVASLSKIQKTYTKCDKIKLNNFYLDSTNLWLESENDFKNHFDSKLLGYIIAGIIKERQHKKFDFNEYSETLKIFPDSKKNKLLSLKKILRDLLTFNLNLGYGVDLISAIKLMYISRNIKLKKVDRKEVEIRYKNKIPINYLNLVDKLICDDLKVTQQQIIFNDLEQKKKKRDIKLFFVFNSIYYDTSKKIKFFLEEFNSNINIIPIQHGGHQYGSYSGKFGIVNNVDYSYKYFISWGQKELFAKKKVSVLSLPSPMLSKFYGKHHKKNNNIFYIGAGESIFYPRLEYAMAKSKTTERINNRNNILNYFHKKEGNNFFYRPSKKGFFVVDDLFYSKTFSIPNLSIKDFHKEILKSKYIILDHPGTTLNIAFSANIPCFLVFKIEDYDFTKKFISYLLRLKKIGVYHENSSSLISFLENKNSNTEILWKNDDFQKIRKELSRSYCLAKKNWLSHWKINLNKLNIIEK